MYGHGHGHGRGGRCIAEAEEGEKAEVVDGMWIVDETIAARVEY